MQKMISKADKNQAEAPARWSSIMLPTDSPREKPRWRQRQRNLATAEKVALLGQTILETLEVKKIKKHAKGL
jgi:hypothetical protein